VRAEALQASAGAGAASPAGELTAAGAIV
jgi:hypothetical protein